MNLRSCLRLPWRLGNGSKLAVCTSDPPSPLCSMHAARRRAGERRVPPSNPRSVPLPQALARATRVRPARRGATAPRRTLKSPSTSMMSTMLALCRSRPKTSTAWLFAAPFPLAPLPLGPAPSSGAALPGGRPPPPGGGGGADMGGKPGGRRAGVPSAHQL